MDITKRVWAKIKFPGIKDPIFFNDGEFAVTKLIGDIIMCMRDQNGVKQGDIEIRLNYQGPIPETMMDADMQKMYEQLLPLCIPADQIYADDPRGKILHDYITNTEWGPDIQEYRLMANYQYRENKTAEFIKTVCDRIQKRFPLEECIIMHGIGSEWWHTQ